ncbi:MAG: amidohydrolase family protein, partial [Planctomycetota bacterium]
MSRRGFFSRSLLWLILTLNTFLHAQTTPLNGIRDQTPSLLALTHAKIVLSPESTLENATLLIQSGKILAVGTSVSIPPEATLLDLSGYVLYPGFIDPYTNYGIEKISTNKVDDWRGSPQPEGTRKGGNAWNDAIHAEMNGYASFTPNLNEIKEFLSQGITTVQSAKMDGIFRGRAFVTLLLQGIPNDLILRAKTSHWMSFNKGSSSQNYPNSLMGSIALIRQTFLDTEWYRKAELAYSLNSQQKRPEFNATLNTLEWVVPETASHIPSYTQETILWECQGIWDILRARRIAEEFGLKVVYLGNNDEYTRIETLQALHPTLILPVNYPQPPSVETYDASLDVTVAQLRHFERAPYNPAVLEARQIPFAFTTHLLKQKSDYLKNIRKAVQAGLSPKQALAALTTIPAEICSVTTEVGTLSAGKIANFLVCNGDIFQEKTILHAVWIQGQEQLLQPFPKVDFRGKARLVLFEQEYDLELQGEVFALQGKLVPVKPETPKPSSFEVLSSKDGKLQGVFTLELPDKTSGVFRFSGRKQQEQLSLELLTPSGESLLISVRQEPILETKPPEKPPESTPAPLS